MISIVTLSQFSEGKLIKNFYLCITGYCFIYMKYSFGFFTVELMQIFQIHKLASIYCSVSSSTLQSVPVF